MSSLYYSHILKIKFFSDGKLNEIINLMAKCNVNVHSMDTVETTDLFCIRDIVVYFDNENEIDMLLDCLRNAAGVEIISALDRAFLFHEGGKIEIKNKVSVKNKDQLSMAYTPGVARVCAAIQKDVSLAKKLTIKSNCVAVVSDGSAVLGLGNIGPYAGIPVMEGKAMLFKEFANINAFPICLSTKDSDEIVNIVKNIAPVFGGINLEDISSPRCFEIERRLQSELDIPVFHDDQHGTAIVMMAALKNALKLVNKQLSKIKIVFNGVGAAGIACTKMLIYAGAKNIVGCDRNGAIHLAREMLSDEKLEYARITNPHSERGALSDVIQDADVFIGLSSANVLKVSDIKKMNKDSIVFAMANPIPEIMPEIARPHVAIMATGRSDYPNQINNLLAFPGVFKGVLRSGARRITREMHMAAVDAIASIVDDSSLCKDYIIPSVFNLDVVESVSKAVESVF